MSLYDTSILIVEDEQEILVLLEKIFSKYFNKIYTANNGKVALDILRETNPDLILTDIRMPEMGGFELLIELRAEGKNTPVVVISSSQDRVDLMKAMKLGVLDFVEKPFKRHDVEMAIHRVLEISVRNNDLPALVLKYGNESDEVRHQKKMIGLLQAISAKGAGTSDHSS